MALLRWALRALRAGRPAAGPFDAVGVLETSGARVFAIVFAAWLMSKIEKVSWGDYGLPPRRAASLDTLAGLLWGFGSLSISMLGLHLAGCYHIDGRALAGAAAIRHAFLWAGAFVAVALSEELSFRGYALFTLASGNGFWPAAALSSAVFVLIHLANPGENWMGLTGVFFIAIFFCFTLWRTGNLWFAVAMHASWDWGLSYFYSVPDSGIAAIGHLFNARLEGPAWLSGGTAGPEGSALNLALLCGSSFLFSRFYPRRRWTQANESRAAAA